VIAWTGSDLVDSSTISFSFNTFQFALLTLSVLAFDLRIRCLQQRTFLLTYFIISQVIVSSIYWIYPISCVDLRLQGSPWRDPVHFEVRSNGSEAVDLSQFMTAVHGEFSHGQVFDPAGWVGVYRTPQHCLKYLLSDHPSEVVSG
jgi:hypothetical protein